MTPIVFQKNSSAVREGNGERDAGRGRLKRSVGNELPKEVVLKRGGTAKQR